MLNQKSKFKLKPPSSIQWRIIAFVAIVALGAVGWYTSPLIPEPGNPTSSIAVWVRIIDSIYRSLQLFLLNYDHPDLEHWTPSWWLFLARFVAPAYVSFEIIFEFFLPARNFLIDQTKSFFHPEQYLIIGYGLVGQGLAKALKAAKPQARIVALDRHVSALDRQEEQYSNIELYQADAREIESIHTVPFRLREAKRIFVSVGNDQQTIATAAELVSHLGSKSEGIWMQLNDWPLLDRLRNASVLAKTDARKIRSFSLAEAIGVQLIAQHRPVLMARAAGQNRLHAVLVRFDDFVWAIAEALMLAGTSPPPRLAQPRLTIIDAQGDIMQERWQARHPDLWQWADITFYSTDPTTISWSGADSLLHKIEILDPPTLYIFGRCGGGDALSDALSLRHGMEKGLRQPAPVFVISEVTGIENLGLREVKANLQDRLTIIGRAGEIAAYSHAVEPWIETLVKAFHSRYKDRSGGPSFEELPETLQVSNRRAALHSLQILAYLGFEQADVQKPALGLSKSAIKYFSTLLPQRAAQCAEYEHLRWCVDRTIDGWQKGPRDDEARRRTQLGFGRFKYEELTQSEQEKDKDQMLVMAEILEEHKAEQANNFANIVDYDGKATPALKWADSVDDLWLGFVADPDWSHYRAAHPGVHTRLRLIVPPEPDGPRTPVQRAAARRRAYKIFIEQTLSKAPPEIHFRLARAKPEGWNWLGDLDETAEIFNRVDGITLPPLTIGFAGHRDLTKYGPAEEITAHIQAELDRILVELSQVGRPMRLITGVAEGADSIMIKCWSDRKLGPILGLYPAPPLGAKNPLLSVSEVVPQEQEGDARHADVARRILDGCDVLIAVHDGSPGGGPGGTADTVSLAGKIGIKMLQVSPKPAEKS